MRFGELLPWSHPIDLLHYRWQSHWRAGKCSLHRLIHHQPHHPTRVRSPILLSREVQVLRAQVVQLPYLHRPRMIEIPPKKILP